MYGETVAHPVTGDEVIKKSTRKSPFGQFSLEAEQKVLKAAGCGSSASAADKPRGIDAAILRLTDVYGGNDADGDTFRTVTRLVHNAIRSQPLILFDGIKRLDFLHVSDAARAVRAAISLMDRRQSADMVTRSCDLVFNVGAGEPVTMPELVREVLNATNSLSKVAVQPRHEESEPCVKDIQVNLTKTIRGLDFVPKVRNHLTISEIN